jgi:hypothetical protein
MLRFADGHAEVWIWKSPYVGQGNAIPDLNPLSTTGPGWNVQASGPGDVDLPRLQQTFPEISY